MLSEFERFSGIEVCKDIADAASQAMSMSAGDGRCSSDLPHSPDHGVVLV